MDTKPMGRVKHAWVKGGAVSWIGFAALLLAAVLVAVCLYTALFGAVTEMPFMTFMASMDDSPLEDLEKVLRDGKATEREARSVLKEAESKDLSKNERKLLATAEDFLDQFGDFLDVPSLMTMRTMIKTVITDQELLQLLELAENEDAARQTQQEAKDILNVLDIIVIVAAACFGLCILLTVLAAMFRGIVPTVFGMLGALPLCALFGGGTVVAVVLVLYIVGIVLLSVLRGSYNKYRNAAGLQ